MSSKNAPDRPVRAPSPRLTGPREATRGLARSFRDDGGGRAADVRCVRPRQPSREAARPGHLKDWVCLAHSDRCHDSDSRPWISDFPDTPAPGPIGFVWLCFLTRPSFPAQNQYNWVCLAQRPPRNWVCPARRCLAIPLFGVGLARRPAVWHWLISMGDLSISSAPRNNHICSIDIIPRPPPESSKKGPSAGLWLGDLVAIMEGVKRAMV